MNRLACLVILAGLALPQGAAAQDRDWIGSGRIFNNDVFGDGFDRWRTGSFSYSHNRARDGWSGTVPARPGDLLEYRLRAEIIAAQRGTTDRPYVGALSAGVFTHAGQGPLSFMLGAEATAIGPQTGLAGLQEAYHDTFGLPRPPTRRAVLADDFTGSAYGAASYRVDLPGPVSLRPFASAQAGAEDLVRVGADVLVGQVGQDDLLLRDVVTGQLYRGTQDDYTRGVSWTVGADVAQVKDSYYLPESAGYLATDTRARARAGVHWQPAPEISFFYGVTYLSEEFEGQPEGQVLGSLKLNFNF